VLLNELAGYIPNTEDATFDQLTQRMLAAQHLEDVIPPDAYTSTTE
jgi:hypothetical protein